MGYGKKRKERIAAVIKEAGVSNSSYNADYIVIGDTSYSGYEKAACHYGLKRISHPVFCVVNFVYKDTYLSPEVETAYTDWLLGKSPYKSVFVENRLEKGAEYFTCRANVPSNLLVGGLIAYRAIREYPDIVVAWHELVVAGGDPNLSFLIAHALPGIGESDLTTNCIREGGHHQAVCSSLTTRQGAKAFCEGDLSSVHLLQNYSDKDGRVYRDVQKTWCIGEKDKALKDMILRHMAMKGKEVSRTDSWGDVETYLVVSKDDGVQAALGLMARIKGGE